MSALTIWAEDEPSTSLLETEDPERITSELADLGVRFERWPLAADLRPAAPADEILAAYREPVDRVVAEHGYVLVDVAALRPTGEEGWAQQAASARQRFLEEHTHDDDEDRFFVEGAGIFYLHLAGRVHAMLCEAGDLLSVPRSTTHWFDMGTDPCFVAVRFFHDTDGWVGNFTGSPIASRFPDFDALAGRFAAR